MSELFTSKGEKAGLYDVCDWLVKHYPEDLFVSDHPVHRMRDLAREILEKGGGGNVVN